MLERAVPETEPNAGDGQRDRDEEPECDDGEDGPEGDCTGRACADEEKVEQEDDGEDDAAEDRQERNDQRPARTEMRERGEGEQLTSGRGSTTGTQAA